MWTVTCRPENPQQILPIISLEEAKQQYMNFILQVVEAVYNPSTVSLHVVSQIAQNL